MLQTGAKGSNIGLLKARGGKWTISKPEHLGPLGRHDKLKFIGVTISRQPTETTDLEEGTYF
eukprot:5579165-Prorocentrum_lima.AAC.1